MRWYVPGKNTSLRVGGIEYRSPDATTGRKRRQEGAPRDHIECAVVLKDCLCETPYTHKRHSVPHIRPQDWWPQAHRKRKRSLVDVYKRGVDSLQRQKRKRQWFYFRQE
jgi:hypothetical protein